MKTEKPDLLKLMGGTLIIAGTAIGAGMLALPVVTSLGGFLPSIVIYLLCYLFSVCTGLLFLEICLWMPQDANVISMAQHLLGKTGKVFAWILYIFLFYCLVIAYVSGGGGFIASALGDIPLQWGMLIFTGTFGTVIYISTKAIDRINFLLMMGLIVSFVLFVIFGVSHVDTENLSRINWGASFMSLPVIFTAFSYQGTIPSLNTYLGRNAKMMRFAIIVGSSIPFLTYILWQFLILGIVPPDGLLIAKEEGLTAISPLKNFLASSPVYIIGQFFGFFALTTSFLGVSLGLLDFFSDALQVAKVGMKKLGLCLLIFVPALTIALSYPGIFLRALGYAGGVGCALLLGFFPALMVWRGRYRMGYPALDRQLPGGRVTLLILFAFIAFELAIEVAGEFFT